MKVEAREITVVLVRHLQIMVRTVRIMTALTRVARIRVLVESVVTVFPEPEAVSAVTEVMVKIQLLVQMPVEADLVIRVIKVAMAVTAVMAVMAATVATVVPAVVAPEVRSSCLAVN